MRRSLALAVVPLLMGVAACEAGESPKTYDGAKAVAKAAGLKGCKPTEVITASESVRCRGGAGASWFQSQELQDGYRKVVATMAEHGFAGSVQLYGDRWVVRCETKVQCNRIQERIGGTFD